MNQKHGTKHFLKTDKMKKVILISYVLLFMGACEEKLCVSKELRSKLITKFKPIDKPTNDSKRIHKSTAIDIRCDKLWDEAREKGKETGVCYDGPLIVGRDIEAEEADPDYEACLDLMKEANKKCEALPYDPESIIQLSGSGFISEEGIIIDGELITIDKLKDCEKCSNCRKLTEKEINKPDEPKTWD